MALNSTLVAVALLLLLSIFGSKASGRLGVPALVLFLVIGMLAGSEGIGGIYFDDAAIAQHLGVIALAFILFAGGLETNWRYVRAAAWRAVSLSTIGVVVTMAVIGVFAHFVAGLPLLHSLLLGAIVAPTDAAAVFSILRSRGVRMKQDLEAVLELESGSNDPAAVFATTSILQLMSSTPAPWWAVAEEFVLEMGLGAIVGVAIGHAAVYVINRTRLDHKGLYPVMTLSVVLLTYGGSALLGGNGFLAVYLAGITMSRRNFIQRRTLIRFHDGVAWLMQIAMFLTLGLLVFPSHLRPVAVAGAAITACLMFLARPVAVFVSLALSRMTFREKLAVSWVGLRGAVPIVLATFPLLAGIPMAASIFNIVFFVVLASVLLQGTTIPLVARALSVEDAGVTDESHVEAHLAGRGESAVVTLEVAPGSRAAHRRVVELAWPLETLILVVYRGNDFFVPSGATEIEPNDRLIVLTTKASVDALRAAVDVG